VRKWRTLYEGEQWDPVGQTNLSAETFDEVFRFAAENIATAPTVNTTPFLTDRHRIMRLSLPNVVELWVYFRIEPDDESCTLLWMVARGIRVG
jgi:hypothetical protein